MRSPRLHFNQEDIPVGYIEAKDVGKLFQYIAGYDIDDQKQWIV